MSGQCLSSDVPGHALTPGTRRRLGRPLPHQQADRTWTDPEPPELCPPDQEIQWGHQVLPALSLVSGTEAPGTPLSLCSGYVVHVFLTRPPLTYPLVSRQVCPLDLHALTTPPAFDLSQDQTLRFKSLYPKRPRPMDPDGSITTDLGLSFFAFVRMKAAGSRKNRLHRVLAKPAPIRRRIGER